MTIGSLSVPLPNLNGFSIRFLSLDSSGFRCTVDKAGRNPQPNSIKAVLGRSKIKSLATRMSLSSSNGGLGNTLQGIGENDGVIIVDHGSRRKESNLMLNEFVTMFKDKTGYPIVEPAHMELAEPSIKDAFGMCVQKGAKRVVVSPFFLFPGRHWHQVKSYIKNHLLDCLKDIPSLTAEAAKEHPGVSYLITAPLGLHELLVDVVNDRIRYCLSHVTGDVEECEVCVGTNKCKLNLNE
ncbi:Sirohydrochlorin ferrochelatase, chloroplastic [Linum perenne]